MLLFLVQFNRASNTSSEKIEDAKAKAAVKAQIEADKKARADKAAREKAAREGKLVEEAGPVNVAAPAAAAPTASRDYKETRLQIRLAGGAPLTTTLPSESSTFSWCTSVTSLGLTHFYSIAERRRVGRVAELNSCHRLFDVQHTISSVRRSDILRCDTAVDRHCRKVFSASEWSQSLRELGLTPSAVSLYPNLVASS